MEKNYLTATPKLHKAGEIFVQVVSLYMLGKWREIYGNNLVFKNLYFSNL